MGNIEKKIELDVPVQYLPRVGPKAAEKLARLGVNTIRDLIWFFPRKYLDYSQISTIESVTSTDLLHRNDTDGNSDAITIRGRIVGIANKKTRKRGFTVTEAVVEDGTGTLKVVWFNQPYLSKMMPAGREIILHGRVNWDQFNQTWAMESPDWAQKPKIVPVYRETDGIRSYYLAKLISKIKDEISKIVDFLPAEIVKERGLLPLDEAIGILHQPANMAELERARERMAFDELFLISLRGQVLKQELKKDKSISIDAKNSSVGKLIEKLPYELTGDQKQAWHDIVIDIARETPMNRMLNGDVGSGKTVVAALATYAVYRDGKSAILMAPTEILANQHYESFQSLLPKDVEIELIVSSNKKQRLSISFEKPKILIGTHALLYLENIPNLALVVIDEQHRFGVSQRAKLLTITNNQPPEDIIARNEAIFNNKEIAAPADKNIGLARNDSDEVVYQSNNLYIRPHFLSMTATPIPRSLQLALFAELDVSVIKEKPKNRKEIKTRVVDEVHRQKAYEFIRAHVKAGRQVFVVCPLIEEKNKELTTTDLDHREDTDKNNIETAEQFSNQNLFEIDRKTVASEYQKLSKEIFPDLRIGMLHGKMKSAEKDETMSKFSNHELDILVSTSVVEVGVDIPNATVMMIEDAERFGLSQLHQFRGRVGRGDHQSFCFLFSNSESEKSLERLRRMEETSDGFKLAEFDLKTRGAGDIFGTDQSGFMDIKFANLSNAVMIANATESAKILVESDPKLVNFPLLKSKLEQFNSSKHFE